MGALVADLVVSLGLKAFKTSLDKDSRARVRVRSVTSLKSLRSSSVATNAVASVAAVNKASEAEILCYRSKLISWTLSTVLRKPSAFSAQTSVAPARALGQSLEPARPHVERAAVLASRRCVKGLS